ncbi:SEC-C domain-containing protein [Myxococcus sp. K15C18031901]|uniref:YecA family protein n=1 Tax=Myxococcus dinghuensis TaxID=2906761 RepID=UPI0020A7FF4D|nr:SEC-C domain-containing protein [Myxococcus dinghuensis]MCP3105339.1 SEC-C domain-containing protein [Myxococcus dinghuensis]
MQHDDYFDAFKLAAQKSVELGLISNVPDKKPELGHAIDAFGLVGSMINSMRHESTQIRTMCGQIHAELWRWLRSEGVNCLVTIGDVEIGGKREFGTTYTQLELEMRGALRDSTKPYAFHVWLTFPDIHIIDVTYFVYKHHDLLPERWTWSEYVVCSSHSFSRGVDTRYVPFLIGDATMVERIIFNEPLAQIKNLMKTPNDLLGAMTALGIGGRPADMFGKASTAAHGKVGRNEPCPCGSGRKFKRCHASEGGA